MKGALSCINSDPIVKSAVASLEDGPLEEHEEEEGDEFVTQRRRKSGRKSKKSSNCKRDAASAQIFVENVPDHVTKMQLKQVFSGFGEVKEVYLHFDDDNCVKFALVTFVTLSGIESVLRRSDPVILRDEKGQSYQLIVQLKKERKTQAEQPSRKANIEEKKLVGKNRAATTRAHNTVAYAEKVKETGSTFEGHIRDFDWFLAGSQYALQKKRMEDYLATYVFHLSSYRMIDSEKIADLENLLVDLANRCPEDKFLIMPPLISGLVHNQAKGHHYVKEPSNGRTLRMSTPRDHDASLTNHDFRVEPFLNRFQNWFKLEGDRVIHVGTLTRNDAMALLKRDLVEGTFLYFFSKFSHTKKFTVSESYYKKSEPIRSALKLITNKSDISEALPQFFKYFAEIFAYDGHNLTLRRDFFDPKEHKDLDEEYEALAKALAASKAEMERVLNDDLNEQKMEDKQQAAIPPKGPEKCAKEWPPIMENTLAEYPPLVPVSKRSLLPTDLFLSQLLPQKLKLVSDPLLTPTFEQNGHIVDENNDRFQFGTSAESTNYESETDIRISVSDSDIGGFPVPYDLPYVVRSSVELALEEQPLDLNVINAEAIEYAVNRRLGPTNENVTKSILQKMNKQAQRTLKEILDEYN